MRFLKRNFILIFLIISSIGMGILAVATALRLREFKQVEPQQTKALTPVCSLTFTIEDTTPRQNLIGQIPTTTITISVTSTPQINPTVPTSRPTATRIPVTPTVTTTVGSVRLTLPTSSSNPTPTTHIALTRPTVTLRVSPTPTIIRLAQINPTATNPPRLTNTPRPTSTPIPTTSSQKGGTQTVTVTPVEPELPVSGINKPTIGAITIGLIFLFLGIFVKKSLLS